MIKESLAVVKYFFAKNYAGTQKITLTYWESMFYYCSVIKEQFSKNVLHAHFLFRIFTKFSCSSFVANEYIFGEGEKTIF